MDSAEVAGEMISEVGRCLMAGEWPTVLLFLLRIAELGFPVESAGKGFGGSNFFSSLPSNTWLSSERGLKPTFLCSNTPFILMKGFRIVNAGFFLDANDSIQIMYSY